MPSGHKGKTHGILATYNTGCHCEPCRKANAERNRKRRRDIARSPGRTLLRHLRDPEQAVRHNMRRATLKAKPMVDLVPAAPPKSGMSGGWQDMGGANSILTDFSQRSLYRAKAAGWVSPHVADTICCQLGMNPALVYGIVWDCASLCPLYWRKVEIDKAALEVAV